ncbi:MAG: hypothetical protein ACLUT1_01600 [Ruminococcus sp.]
MTVVDHGVVITSGTKQEISAYMDQNILLTVTCKDITAVTQPVLMPSGTVPAFPR